MLAQKRPCSCQDTINQQQAIITRTQTDSRLVMKFITQGGHILGIDIRWIADYDVKRLCRNRVKQIRLIQVYLVTEIVLRKVQRGYFERCRRNIRSTDLGRREMVLRSDRDTATAGA